MWLFKLSWKSQNAFPLNMWGYVVVIGLMYGIQLAFYTGMYQISPEIGGFTQEEIVFLCYISSIVTILSDSFDCSIFQFYHKVATGEIGPYLTKPLSTFQLMFLRWCKPATLLLLVPILALWRQVDPLPERPWLSMVVGCLCIVLGAAAVTLSAAALSIGTFLSQREMVTEFIMAEMHRLTQVPHTVYGAPWRAVAFIALPVLISASSATAALVRADFQPFQFLLLGTLLLSGTIMVGYRKAFRAFDLLGG